MIALSLLVPFTPSLSKREKRSEWEQMTAMQKWELVERMSWVFWSQKVKSTQTWGKTYSLLSMTWTLLPFLMSFIKPQSHIYNYTFHLWALSDTYFFSLFLLFFAFRYLHKTWYHNMLNTVILSSFNQSLLCFPTLLKFNHFVELVFFREKKCGFCSIMKSESSERDKHQCTVFNHSEYS